MPDETKKESVTVKPGDSVVLVGGHRQKIPAKVVKVGKAGVLDLKHGEDEQLICGCAFDAEAKTPDSWHLPPAPASN